VGRLVVLADVRLELDDSGDPLTIRTVADEPRPEESGAGLERRSPNERRCRVQV
jgi:hypothetical protein